MSKLAKREGAKLGIIFQPAGSPSPHEEKIPSLPEKIPTPPLTCNTFTMFECVHRLKHKLVEEVDSTSVPPVQFLAACGKKKI